MIILGLSKEKYSMSVEYLVIQEGKEAVRDYWGHVKRTQQPV